MEDESTLDRINREDHVNETISRDEESPVKEDNPAMQQAEDLILQLPTSHRGRRDWLSKYGRSEEARKLRTGD